MGDLDQLVGGLRCHEVLAALSEYLDGELGPDMVARMEAHVRGCDRCERFGGEFAAAVTRLRLSLGTPAPLPPEVARRLRDRMAAG